MSKENDFVWLLVPAGLFIGAGVGFILGGTLEGNNIAFVSSTMIGLGIGFVLVIIIKFISK